MWSWTLLGSLETMELDQPGNGLKDIDIILKDSFISFIMK